jgi:hypothetical protein
MVGFSDWTEEETVVVTKGEVAAVVVQVVMTTSPEVCWTHWSMKLWELGRSCRKATTLF